MATEVTHAVVRFKDKKFSNTIVKIEDIYFKGNPIKPDDKQDFSEKVIYKIFFKNCSTDDCQFPEDNCCRKYPGYIVYLGGKKNLFLIILI